ncbi:ATP-binding protein [Candidatus Woesearchaeota archaeon]|nr:ATP-binding protein [Candidatus Woesearchaeota archaeon]RLE40959.1 MAG: ATP-binding protein [Candidatus Woesearchaeota archaeon]
MNPKILFYDREDELKFLESRYRTNKFEFLVFYGRRRIGKTALLTHFLKGKPHIYFLADKRGSKANLDRFLELASKVFRDYKPVINNFVDAFKYIRTKTHGKRFVVCIDEFSYLVEKDPDIPSEFQRVVDEVLKRSKIMLILCGSSISMMEKGVLSYRSPLYGRRTGQWKVMPFKLKAFAKCLRKLDIENLIKVYSVFGDVPAYFLCYDQNKSFAENIKGNILTKGSFLYDEGEFLLRQELKEPETYFSILHAMTLTAGLSKLASLANIPAKDTSKYLRKLESIDLVERIHPMIAKRKTRKTLYFIKDSFLNFWFRFVYPNKSELEEGRVNGVFMYIKNDLEKEIHKGFERFCTRLLKEGLLLKSFHFTKIGKQWGRIKGKPKKINTYEIDILAVDEVNKKVLACECKWKDGVNAEEVCNDLLKKIGYVEWHKDRRKEFFAVFAKSFRKKIDVFDGKKVFCFDLEDLKHCLGK